jgi:hypothetical protein
MVQTLDNQLPTQFAESALFDWLSNACKSSQGLEMGPRVSGGRGMALIMGLSGANGTLVSCSVYLRVV